MFCLSGTEEADSDNLAIAVDRLQGTPEFWCKLLQAVGCGGEEKQTLGLLRARWQQDSELGQQEALAALTPLRDMDSWHEDGQVTERCPSRYFECPLCIVEEHRECCRRESPGLCWVCGAEGLLQSYQHIHFPFHICRKGVF